MTAIPRPIQYSLTALFLSQLALTATAIWVSTNNTQKATVVVAHNAEKANQQWCSTLRVFQETYKDAPPTTEAGRKIRDGLNSVYEAYHCDQVQEP